MAQARGDYSGRPQYDLYFDVSVANYSGGQVRFNYHLYAHSKRGNGSWSYDARPYSAYIGGTRVASGNASLPFTPGDYTGKIITLAQGTSPYMAIGNYAISASHVNNGVFGSAYASSTINVATVPPPPNPVATTPDQITATSMRYQFNSAGTGGSPIIRWEYQWSTSPTFASGNSALFTSSGTSIVTDLPPSTTIYFRSRGVNAIGTGGWSTIRSGTTLATGAPGIAIVPSLDGQSAVVGLTPPPTMPDVTSYKLEYRLQGGSATAVTVSSPYTVSPLTPGSTYEYRAAAISGNTVGPYTAWESVTQPQTNTNPGDYFDGNTPAKADLTYAWGGVANNSISRAIGKAVTGWGTFSSGSSASGGSGVVYRVTGGRSQAYAARVDFFAGTTDPGFHAGIATDAASAFPALQGATYGGLIHVRPLRRAQRLAAIFIWVDAGGAEVGRSVGPDSLVPSSATQWTALRATGTPPPGAVRGALRVIDVQGDGWSLWAAGDSILIDDAIAPFSDYYFDGNTADTGTTDYVWDGAVNASSSRAIPSLTPAPDPLADPDCPPIPAPPRPPYIDDACVEDETDEWRRFSQTIQPFYVHSWIDSVPILRITTKTAARLVRVRYYPNPFGRTLEELERDSYCSEQIISYIPAGTIFTLDGVSQRAFAEVSGSSQNLAADHLLRSDSNLWPALGCGIGYYVTVDVPSDTPVDALSITYSLVHRY